MSYFRLRSVGGNHWPPLPEAGLSQVWAAYLTLDRTQWLDATEVERHQLAQLRALLDHCLEQVPYYSEMLRAQGIMSGSIQSMDEFRRIPILSRRAWQDRFQDLCALQLPPGTVALDEDKTSGTSGEPVRILKTNVFYVWWLACYLRDLEWSGLTPTGIMAAIRATLKTGLELEQLLRGMRMPSWNPILEPLLEMGPLYAMDIGQESDRQIDWLHEVNPDYILSHTSNLELLAGILLDEPRHFPHLRIIQAISETLTETAQTKIETAFGAPVKNLYSCAEAGYLASPCPLGHGLHVHAENVILEVLDDTNQPCKPGQTGRVVLTVLHNFRTPFIRYDIGDQVTLGHMRCPCGRGLPSLVRVLGKRRPMFRLAGNRLKHSSGLVHAISAIGGDYQHQAEQIALDHVIVRIVPSKSWTTDHAAKLRRAVQEFFEWQVCVDVEIKDSLELPRSGKLQSMICDLLPQNGPPGR
jgi:phenylacetate-CoA ligase